MPSSPVALVIATHPQQCRTLVSALEELGLRPALAFTVEDARQVLHSPQLAVVISAPRLLDGTYREVLQQTQARKLPMVLMLHHGAADQSVAAADAGVAGFLTFPFTASEVEQVLRDSCGSAIPFPRRAASA